MAAKKYSFESVSLNCNKCKGACWDSNSAKRQENAIQKFGVIPNACVDSQVDGPKCPFRP